MLHRCLPLYNNNNNSQQILEFSLYPLYDCPARYAGKNSPWSPLFSLFAFLPHLLPSLIAFQSTPVYCKFINPLECSENTDAWLQPRNSLGLEMGSGICICIPPPQIILLWVVQELPCADHCVRRAWGMGEGWFAGRAANTPTVASVSHPCDAAERRVEERCSGARYYIILQIGERYSPTNKRASRRKLIRKQWVLSIYHLGF